MTLKNLVYFYRRNMPLRFGRIRHGKLTSNRPWFYLGVDEMQSDWILDIGFGAFKKTIIFEFWLCDWPNYLSKQNQSKLKFTLRLTSKQNKES